MSEISLESCRDGSHTLFSSRYHEYYHNPNGAVAESRYVFLEKTGIRDFLSDHDEVRILEIGFGTGLNFLLTVDLLLQMRTHPHQNCRMKYFAVDAFPIDEITSRKLNYGSFLENSESAGQLAAVFRDLKPGKNIFTPSAGVELHLFHGFFDQFQETPLSVNFIFFDAFSPPVNPDLWTGKVFSQLKERSHPEVILSTYCAASAARAAMAWAGWHVARVPGTLGKREMTLAALNPALLEPYPRINESRLADRYGKGEFDRPASPPAGGQ